MAQGMGISVLVRAHETTGDARYIHVTQLARAVLQIAC
jgi:hypothetical protein